MRPSLPPSLPPSLLPLPHPRVLPRQVWCGVERPAAVRLGLLEDPHAPDPVRVAGPLSQLPAFAAAFRCRPADPMDPPARCALW